MGNYKYKINPWYIVSYKGVWHYPGEWFEIDAKDFSEMSNHGEFIREEISPAEEPKDELDIPAEEPKDELDIPAEEPKKITKKK